MVASLVGNLEPGAELPQNPSLGNRLGQLSELPPAGPTGGVGPSDIGGPLVGMEGGPPMQGPPVQAPPGAAPGGPGPDTPIEQQTLQRLTQIAQELRQTANDEPSIRFIVDGALQDLFMKITKHYGMEEEGKLAMAQAQLQQRNANAVRRAGPPGPPGSVGLV